MSGDSDQTRSDIEQCYVGECEVVRGDMEAIEAHIRETDDYAHNVTSAFLPADTE